MKFSKSENWSYFGKNIFTEDELMALHEATIEVLSKTGIFVEAEDAREYFEKAGADVDNKSCIVKIPQWMVEEAVKSAPSTFTLAGQSPEFDFKLSKGRVGFASFGCAPVIKDIDSGEKRPSVKRDLEDYAHIVDQLDAYNLVCNAVTPTDVPLESCCLHEFDAFVRNTRKHITVQPGDRVTARAIIEMAAAVVGSRQALMERPLISLVSCPTSPLMLSEVATSGIIEFSQLKLPLFCASMVLAGGTGPVTAAGTLVVHNAELLSQLILSQIVGKGTPFWYGSCTSIMDMKSGNCVLGCAEQAMYSAAITQIAHYYDLPCIVAGGWTDSRSADLQAGIDKGLSTVIPALSGANVVYGGGGLAGGMVLDYSSLVAENDLYNEIQFILNGINVSEDTMAVDLIKEVGHKGEYLTHQHTFKNMRGNQFYPEYFTRDTEDGGKSLYEIATEKARELLRNKNSTLLSDKVNAKLDKIIAEMEKELCTA